MSATLRIVVPRLTGRSAVLWLVGTYVAVLVAGGVVWAHEPGNRWAVAVVGVLVVASLAWSLGSRTWVDLASGTLGGRTGWLPRRTPMSGVARLDLVSNGAGGALLAVRPTRGRRRLVPLLVLSRYVRRSQSSVVLLALADLAAGSHASNGAAVAVELRRQAGFVDSGGPVEASPLARLTGDGLTRSAGAGGALGGGASLLP